MLRCSLIIIIISPPRGNKLRISYCLPKQTLRQSASRDKQNMENKRKKRSGNGSCVCLLEPERSVRREKETEEQRVVKCSETAPKTPLFHSNWQLGLWNSERGLTRDLILLKSAAFLCCFALLGACGSLIKTTRRRSGCSAESQQFFQRILDRTVQKKKKTKHCSTFIRVPVHALMILSSNCSNGRFSVERETPRRAKGSGVVNNVLGTLTQSVSRGGQKYMKKRSFGTWLDVLACNCDFPRTQNPGQGET